MAICSETIKNNVQCLYDTAHCALQTMVIIYDLDASQDGQREASSTPMHPLINMHVIIIKYVNYT